MKPFIIDPEGPDVLLDTPVNYTEGRIKHGAKWAPHFLNLVKKAKLKGGRYYILPKEPGYTVYYDILTHSIIKVFNQPYS